MVSSLLKKMSCCNDSCKEKNKGQRQNIYVPYSFVYKQYQHNSCYTTDNFHWNNMLPLFVYEILLYKLIF